MIHMTNFSTFFAQYRKYGENSNSYEMGIYINNKTSNGWKINNIIDKMGRIQQFCYI